MTCEPCRYAGQLNKAGREYDAAQHHKDCLYPTTCTCQHLTGKFVTR